MPASTQPSLLEAPSHVHRFEGSNNQVINEFFANDVRNSALICGDTAKVLSRIPGEIFQTCITSPPYWSLRDYGIPGQIGLEDSVFKYIEQLTDVFAQVRRVTREDGTLWLNIGDSYTSGGRTWRAPDKKNPVRAMDTRPATPEGLKPKDLIGIPWLLAFALQKEGWYLRADIVWNKPNCQPEASKIGRRDRTSTCSSSARASFTSTTTKRCAARMTEIFERFGTSERNPTRRPTLRPFLPSWSSLAFRLPRNPGT
jgi:hypothetical protein